MPALLGLLTVIGLYIAAIVGWVLNIITLYHSSFTPITGELVVRVIGLMFRKWCLKRFIDTQKVSFTYLWWAIKGTKK